MSKPLAEPPVEESSNFQFEAIYNAVRASPDCKILARVAVQIIGDFTTEGVTIRRLLLAALQNAATTL